MSEKNPFDAALAAYTTRKAAEQDAANAKAAGEEEARARSRDVLVNVVRSALDAASLLRDRGHEAKVGERLENYSNPAVFLSFKPIHPATKGGYIPESTLNFQHSSVAGRLEVMPGISTADGRSGGRHHTESASYTGRELVDVNSDWVTNLAVRFVADVLKAN